MSLKNLYQLLELPNFASPKEIKSAFWHLAKRYHPDTANANHYEDFLEIKYAYEILSNNKKKIAYDEQLENELDNKSRNKQYKIRADKEWIKKYKSDQLKKTESILFDTEITNRNKYNHWKMILISILISAMLILIMVR